MNYQDPNEYEVDEEGNLVLVQTYDPYEEDDEYCPEEEEEEED